MKEIDGTWCSPNATSAIFTVMYFLWWMYKASSMILNDTVWYSYQKFQGDNNCSDMQFRASGAVEYVVAWNFSAVLPAVISLCLSPLPASLCFLSGLTCNIIIFLGVDNQIDFFYFAFFVLPCSPSCCPAWLTGSHTHTAEKAQLLWQGSRSTSRQFCYKKSNV